MVRVKEKLSLRIINESSRHEDVLGSGVISSSFLTSVLDGGEESASRPCRFTHGETDPNTLWIGGWVEPRAGLDNVSRGKFLAPARSRTPSMQPVVYRYTD
jgi:hypothetical protein